MPNHLGRPPDGWLQYRSQVPPLHVSRWDTDETKKLKDGLFDLYNTLLKCYATLHQSKTTLSITVLIPWNFFLAMTE